MDLTASSTRRSRLRRRLRDLYERVNAGVHSDVSSQEAEFLFLDTYLLLGEVLGLTLERDEDLEDGQTQGPLEG